jgi:hypothetical protein
MAGKIRNQKMVGGKVARYHSPFFEGGKSAVDEEDGFRCWLVEGNEIEDGSIAHEVRVRNQRKI